MPYIHSGLSFRKESPTKKTSVNSETKVNSVSKFVNRIIVILALLAIPGVVGAGLFSDVYADNVDFSVTIAPSLNVTIPTNIVSLNLNPANSAFSSQDLTVSVGTNNITGYTLTMTANSTDLTRTEAVGSTTPTISTLANEVAENEFTANRWGYRFSDNTTNTNYQPFATSIPFNESDSAVNNDARTITFGAKVNTEQAPGTYELALVFTAVANPGLQSLVINFDEGVENVAVKTGSAAGTTVGTVSTSGNTVTGLTYGTAYYLVPTYANGKKLSSWSQDSGAVGTLSSTSAENPTYTIGDGTNAVTLTSQTAATYIKDYTLATCKADGEKTVTDERDGKEYLVRYIKDKNNNERCWMMQNLRYVGDTGSTVAGSSNGSMTIKSATTNINTDKTLTYYSLASSDSSYNNHCDPTNSYTYPCAKAGKDNNNNDTVWYNYAAASVRTITGSSNSTAASYDICPKNWHLPTSTEVNGFDGTSNGNATYATSTQFAPVYGGYYSNGSLNDASTYGYWWSATANLTTYRYGLRYYSSTLYSGSNNYLNRYYGYYVRCVRSS